MDEARPAADPVVEFVRLMAKRVGGRPQAIDSTLRVSDNDLTVIGVTGGSGHSPRYAIRLGGRRRFAPGCSADRASSRIAPARYSVLGVSLRLLRVSAAQEKSPTRCAR